MRAKFYRMRYLTGSPIQMMYLKLLMVSMIVPLVFVGGCLYYLIFTLMAKQIGIPEYIVYTLAPVIKEINFILLVGVPPLFLILIVWGIVLSHRFAGPLERIEAELGRIAEKDDYKHRIHLRKRDHLKPLADGINKLLDKIETKHK
jgi:methyl-accepting chemotaxis protein